MEGGAGWPEPVVRVQSLSESGAATIPERYVKPEAERPGPAAAAEEDVTGTGMSIPVVDLSSPGDPATARAVSEACREWGFFQAVNHGVPAELLRRARGVWRGFFRQPMAVKQRYANSPATYEGYGSRLGVEKGAVLDWGDYYFLHVRPPHLLDPLKWPHLPPDLRETTEEYSREVAALCGRLMAAMSAGLGVGEARLQEAFGGAEGAGVCVRVNYYPRCPQPELTLGLSSHSDPGGMTVLLADDRVRGLQVRRRGAAAGWVTVDPLPDAFIVNVGDQIQGNFAVGHRKNIKLAGTHRQTENLLRHTANSGDAAWPHTAASTRTAQSSAAADTRSSRRATTAIPAGCAATAARPSAHPHTSARTAIASSVVTLLPPPPPAAGDGGGASSSSSMASCAAPASTASARFRPPTGHACRSTRSAARVAAPGDDDDTRSRRTTAVTARKSSGRSRASAAAPATSVTASSSRTALALAASPPVPAGSSATSTSVAASPGGRLKTWAF